MDDYDKEERERINQIGRAGVKIAFQRMTKEERKKYMREWTNKINNGTEDKGDE